MFKRGAGLQKRSIEARLIRKKFSRANRKRLNEPESQTAFRTDNGLAHNAIGQRFLFVFRVRWVAKSGDSAHSSGTDERSFALGRQGSNSFSGSDSFEERA